MPAGRERIRAARRPSRTPPPADRAGRHAPDRDARQLLPAVRPAPGLEPREPGAEDRAQQLAPVRDIQPDLPAENILAMHEAVREWEPVHA